MSTSSRLPGSRFWAMPSRPPAKIPACRRYGLAAPSPRRSSKRPGSGMRTMWVRLLPAYVIELGDHVAPESVGAALMRLNEFTVGFHSAHRASALCSTPPRNLYASDDRPSSPLGSWNRFFPPPLSHTDTWAWQPLPVRCMNGL